MSKTYALVEAPLELSTVEITRTAWVQVPEGTDPVNIPTEYLEEVIGDNGYGAIILQDVIDSMDGMALSDTGDDTFPSNKVITLADDEDPFEALSTSSLEHLTIGGINDEATAVEAIQHLLTRFNLPGVVYSADTIRGVMSDPSRYDELNKYLAEKGDFDFSSVVAETISNFECQVAE